MTMTDDAPTLEELDLEHLQPAERARWARQAWRASGGTLSAVELAERFDRSRRWAQDRIAEARAEDAAPAAIDLPPVADGSHAAAPPPAPAADELPPAAPAATVAAEPVPSAATRQPDAPRAAEAAAPAADDERPWERVTDAAGKVGVLLVAAALSYGHMRDVALEAGEHGWRADVWPLSVDGLLLVALVHLRRARRQGGPVAAAWVALVASLGASLAANVASADPTLLGRLVAAWPPLALLMVEVLGRRQPVAAPAAPDGAEPGGGVAGGGQ